MYHFRISDIQNIVTLKSRLGVTQGHWTWHHTSSLSSSTVTEP